MIKNITIENYKCFSNKTKIEMANLTACLGINSVGKSSLIQTLLLFKATYDEIVSTGNYRNSTVYIGLNDKYGLQLGDVHQVISANGKDSVVLSCEEVTFQYCESNNELLFRVDVNVEKGEVLGKSLCKNKLYYLNAERLGPRNYQTMPSKFIDHCGYNGEYTFDFVNKKMTSNIDEKRKFPSDEKQTITFEKQLEYWLQYLVDGVEVNFISNMDMRLSQMKIKQQVFDTAFNSPFNYGFGISYVLPIVATCLAAETNALVIIENPEAHLHPKGQSKMGQFLACMSNAGMQIVIETHSEHIINGIRIYALNNKISPDNIAINYFAIENEEHRVKRINFNDNMDILEWPKGFLDQEENDLRELRILRGKK